MAQINNSQGTSSLGSLLEIVRNLEDYTSLALPQYAKKSIINSRVFIQRECADVEALNDCLRMAMNMYVGFIMTSVNMNQYISSSQTVRDIMQVVATEYARYQYDGLDWEDLSRLKISSEGHLLLPMEEKILTPTMRVNEEDYDTIDPSDITDMSGGISRTSKSTATPSGAKIVEIPPQVEIPSGRIIEIKFGDPRHPTTGNNSALTVNLFLQLTPTFVPAAVADAFIGVNFTPSMKQRFLQMSVGEISFWKDFVLAQDLRKQRNKARRQDKSGTLAEMFDRQQNAVSNAWLKYVTYYREKQNIANTILVFDKATFDRACSRNGLDFKKFNSRQSFFNKTFAMMLMVLDPNYQKVETYFHSLEARGEYTFAQLKSASKSDKYDLTDIMKAYGQGMTPKF